MKLDKYGITLLELIIDVVGILLLLMLIDLSRDGFSGWLILRGDAAQIL